MQHFVVVGAGQAGATLVARLRADGFDGKITLIGAEPVHPYQRPPLSKAYMLGEMELSYAYARIYKKGDILHRHKDRFSCEISTTMNLGGDEWPIYLEAKKNVGTPDDGFPAQSNNKGTKVILKPGDMLVYKGMILEHWREPFNGEDCAQVFLHYNNVESPNAEENMFDGRPHLGLPPYFKGMKLNK